MSNVSATFGARIPILKSLVQFDLKRPPTKAVGTSVKSRSIRASYVKGVIGVCCLVAQTPSRGAWHSSRGKIPSRKAAFEPLSAALHWINKAVETGVKTVSGRQLCQLCQ